ncbi:MAG: helix-turn-helix transcriptional regulator [Lachnospiraceae bacterium]|nr:helix-turn-helix transcriptional regulator [Lachnospiraceae bacterium]
MTVGEKIKYYRNLNGLTQKELGKKALGPIGDSALRIYKYENNVMAPKANYRESIAEALNVDKEALSDIDVQSDADIMHILFLLEEIRGLRVHKENGKIFLDFDEPDENNNNEQLLTYLNIWESAASKETDSSEKKREYELWKGRFAKNAQEYLDKKENEIETYYATFISKHKLITPYAKTTADITRLLRNMLEAGLSVKTSTSNHSHTTSFIFSVNNLLNPPSENAASLFGHFLSEFKHWDELGAGCYSKITMPGKSLNITYSIPIQGFNIIHLQVKDLLNFLEKEEKDDYDIETFEMTFEDSLKRDLNYIETEITNFGTGKKKDT